MTVGHASSDIGDLPGSAKHKSAAMQEANDMLANNWHCQLDPMPKSTTYLDDHQCRVVRLEKRQLVAHEQPLEGEWRLDGDMEEEDG
jgi:hypothetical protein